MARKKDLKNKEKEAIQDLSFHADAIGANKLEIKPLAIRKKAFVQAQQSATQVVFSVSIPKGKGHGYLVKTLDRIAKSAVVRDYLNQINNKG